MDKFKEIISFIRSLYKEFDGIIPLHAPVFVGNEKKYYEECIDSTFVSTMGKFVDQFEKEMEIFTGAEKAVACVNGTSALHLALKMVGLEHGQEAITQPLTFVGTANAISHCGGKSIFLDVDQDTLGLSPEKLENWLKRNTVFRASQPKPFNKLTKRVISACVPMHTFGHPCRIDEIVEICNRFNIPVVEDAAESVGSYYKGKHTGTFGQIGIFSFNGNKIITTGGGGMLLFQDVLLAKKAKHLSTQAKVPSFLEIVHDEIGFNYRMPNINAAMGLAQLELIDKFLRSKRTIASEYEKFFKKTEMKYIVEPENARSNFWLNCILLKNKNERDDFLKYSNENGVVTRPTWTLLNRLRMFHDCQTDDLTNANEFFERLVNLPSSVRL